MSDNAERVGRVRKGRRDGGFTIVRNELINHPELSIEARALIIYLLSRPEDWALRVSDVRRFLGSRSKPCGRDKAYGVIAELKRYRYVVMCEDIDGKHFAGVTYYIFDEPVSDVDEVRCRHQYGDDPLKVASSPLPENPEAKASSLPDLSYPENQEAILNKDNIQTTEIPLTPNRRKTRRRNGSGMIEPIAPQPVVAYYEPWSICWTEFRIRWLMSGREKRPPKATRTIQALIDRGGETGLAEERAHAARHCWPSVNERDRIAVEDGRGCYAMGLRPIDVDQLQNQYHSVCIDSEEFAAWQEAHRLRGWPSFPTPRLATHVLLPKAGPAVLDMANNEEVAA